MTEAQIREEEKRFSDLLDNAANKGKLNNKYNFIYIERKERVSEFDSDYINKMHQKYVPTEKKIKNFMNKINKLKKGYRGRKRTQGSIKG